MSVRKFLDLSTGHLSRHDRDRLTEILADKPPYGSSTSMTGDRGWLIYVSAEPNPEHWSGIPGLVRVIARARELDCDYVLLDADAPTDETLPFFDED
ncbi:DUF5983 family protein [Asaia bogorensis]|uniref:DUF5983 domain-containing protein n=1 Tax=Asaia bogorensis NBRC 16594 TaxID=1231624 RepID=A0AAN4U4E2_9PROT|nr:hypothetical protein [Asaia bogorensis]GBQ81712.1 hypothetical protein AA0311_2682 [Asaia bogorensis NBRC 16594]GEL54790.1 hypothetical protein ABO01nite_27970 [Asaia bogorensis NBRC 16594]